MEYVCSFPIETRLKIIKIIFESNRNPLGLGYAPFQLKRYLLLIQSPWRPSRYDVRSVSIEVCLVTLFNSKRNPMDLTSAPCSIEAEMELTHIQE